MTQSLHIFKKDARHLRWEILLVCIFLVMFAYLQTHPDAAEDGIRDLIATVMLGALWAFVCARLILAEALPGDRQFWITRPYSPASLLGAKLLFVAVFLSLPLLIADTAILAIEGFSIFENAPGLILSVLLLTLGVLLPMCAFATLMRGVTFWILSALLTIGIFAGSYELSDENAWGGLAWQRNLATILILFLAAVFVLLWQYKNRRTPVAIAVMAIGLISAGALWEYAPPLWAAALQTKLSKPLGDAHSIKIVFDNDLSKAGYRLFSSLREDPDLPPPHSVEAGDETIKYLRFPLAITGLSEDMGLVTDRVRSTYRLEQTSPDRVDSHDRTSGNTGSGDCVDAGATWSTDVEVLPSIHLPIDGRFFAKSYHCLATVRLEFFITVYGNPRGKPVDAGGGIVPVSGVGICLNDEPLGVRCVSPLREANKLLELGTSRIKPQLISQTSYSPLPADFALSPLHWYWHRPAMFTKDNPDFTTALEPIGHLSTEVVLRQIYLSKYQTMP